MRLTRRDQVQSIHARLVDRLRRVLESVESKRDSKSSGLSDPCPSLGKERAEGKVVSGSGNETRREERLTSTHLAC